MRLGAAAQAHATAEEAEAETVQMINVYHEFAEQVAAMPVVVGRKSKLESFAGAVATYTIEAMMLDCKALQVGARTRTPLQNQITAIRPTLTLCARCFSTIVPFWASVAAISVSLTRCVQPQVIAIHTQVPCTLARSSALPSQQSILGCAVLSRRVPHTPVPEDGGWGGMELCVAGGH